MVLTVDVEAVVLAAEVVDAADALVDALPAAGAMVVVAVA